MPRVSERVKHLATVAKEKAKKEVEAAAKKRAEAQKMQAEKKKKAEERKIAREIQELVEELDDFDDEIEDLNRELKDLKDVLKGNLKEVKKLEKTAVLDNKKLKEMVEKEMEEEEKKAPLKKDKTLCGGCKMKFGEGEATPRVLDCGHTLCEKCIVEIMSVDGKMQCPFDKKQLEVFGADVQALPKNYSIVSF